MHNAAFSEAGIDARYELRPIEHTGLMSSFFLEVRGPEWLGFQVTAPYKRSAMDYLDVVESDARSIGAVNTGVRTGDGRLIGFNTDGPGFVRSLTDDLGIAIGGARVVVAGAGGASRAVVHECLSGGAESVHIGNRHPARAHEMARQVEDDRLSFSGLDDEFDAALGRADLAVNTTTVGMIDEDWPFDVGMLPAQASVFDLVYTPDPTPLVAEASGRGLRAVTGLGMLVAQAAIAFERWTGIPGAEVVMRRAIESADPASLGAG
jgi:shikimate dehydrogenase